MTLGDLRFKFRQSKDYTHEMLVRDLIEYAQEMESRIAKLDDVAGSWTPDVQFSNAKVGITYSYQYGRYRRVGGLVYYEGEFRMTSKGTSVGAAQILGLPFATRQTGSQIGGHIGYYTGMTLAAGYTPVILGYGVSSTLLLRQHDTNGTANTANITNTNFTDTSRMIFSGMYETDD